MKRFGRAFVVMVGVAVLGFIVSLVPQKKAAAQDAGPTVTIGSPIPLPVKQSGNWNVGLAPNTTVGISGTPTVNVANAALPTQSIGGGAATQVGQVVSQLVNLGCTFGQCFQILPDGSVPGFPHTPYSVPNTKALVITDVEWFGAINTSGTNSYAGCTLLVNGNPVTSFSSQLDSQGGFAGQTHLGTGVVVAPGGTIAPAGCDSHLQGYLVPN